MVDYGYGTLGSIGADGSNRVDFSAMNKGITPVFFMYPEPDERESEVQGRAVYRDAERVHLHIAGDSSSVHSQPVDEGIKRRFSDQYAHWKRTNEGRQITGTPLKMWPMASPTFIKEMEAINIFSVEDLANIADVHVTRIPEGRVWRQKAEAWMKAASDTAASTKFAAENERLRERIEALEGRLGTQEPAKRAVSRTSRSEKMSAMMKARWAERKAKAEVDSNG